MPDRPDKPPIWITRNDGSRIRFFACAILGLAVIAAAVAVVL